MKKIVLAILIVCLVIGAVSFVRLSTPNKISDKISGGIVLGDSNSVSLAPIDTGKISLTQLSIHNKKSDCWVAYDGKVYDVTSFLPRHPGSAGAISPFCGTSEEFAKAFTKQHGTSKVSNLMKVGTLIGDFDIVGKI